LPGWRGFLIQGASAKGRNMKAKALAYNHWLTISGRPIDTPHILSDLQKKIAELSGCFWHFLLHWDLHTVEEVLAAS